MHVYTDGSMLVNHGGTEMGQGLNTKVAQVVAHELGVALRRACACTATDTQQGRQHLGHRGVDRRRPERQGGAGRRAPDPRAPRRLRRARAHGGAAGDVRFANDRRARRTARAIAVRRAGREGLPTRVQLWSDGFYATPGLHWDRDTMQGQPFFYFAYGAAVQRGASSTRSPANGSCCAPTCCTTSAAR